jgi:nicotinate-nucleotide adenylyltransferase
MAPARVALFGGSFNPIHHGHLIAARSVAEQLGANRLIFIPAANPPHKQDAKLAPARHRLEMVRLAIDGEPGWEVSDCELQRRGPSYTFDTVTQLRETLGPKPELCWIVGADSLPELASWYRIEELLAICRIITAARPGWERPDLTPLRKRLGTAHVDRLVADVLETPRIDIAATDIRERVRAGRSIRYLVPERVAQYINKHELYRAT